MDEEEAILNEEAENIARGEAADIPLSNESCEMVASASPDDDLPVDKSSEVVGSTVSPYDSSVEEFFKEVFHIIISNCLVTY